MSVDTAFRRLRDANPVPDPKANREMTTDLGVLLAETQQRSMEMQTQEETTTIPDQSFPPNRGWLLALAAAIVVTLVGIVVLFTTNDTGDVAVDSLAPFPAADAYVAAWNAGDADAFQALFANGRVDRGLSYNQGAELSRDPADLFAAQRLLRGKRRPARMRVDVTGQRPRAW